MLDVEQAQALRHIVERRIEPHICALQASGVLAQRGFRCAETAELADYGDQKTDRTAQHHEGAEADRHRAFAPLCKRGRLRDRRIDDQRIFKHRVDGNITWIAEMPAAAQETATTFGDLALPLRIWADQGINFAIGGGIGQDQPAVGSQQRKIQIMERTHRIKYRLDVVGIHSDEDRAGEIATIGNKASREHDRTLAIDSVYERQRDAQAFV